MKGSTSTLIKHINLWGRSVKKVRDGFIVRTLFVSVCVCWFLSSDVLAGDGGVEGTYVRIDGMHRFVINSDLTYESRFLDRKLVGRGLYEKKGCWLKAAPDNKGNVIFYTADGDSCCAVLRKLGNKTLVEHIWGEKYGVCRGGVYERK